MKDYSPRKGMSEEEIQTLVDDILTEATLAEKVGMMSGKGFYQQYRESNRRWGGHAYRAGGGVDRLGVPALYFTDGPRGVARGNSTCFPCSMARGATFDVDLEERIGQVMGVESKAQGVNLSGAVCINLLRHPAWGRAQETYGEDQHHLGEMGAALGRGIQSHNVIATVKHFALNSMENARFKVDVRVDERTLHEVYLPHFKRCIESGIASVMTAYNKFNGEYCGQHHHLLTDILRDEWGFDGFVHSDWINGVYQTYGATAGLDIENPEPEVFGEKLLAAVNDGLISEHTVDRACRRILTITYRFLSRVDPLPSYPPSLVAQESHRKLALEAAQKSIVLLENNGVLPLQRQNIKKLAVLGRLAAIENTGDNGSSRVAAPYVITALQGLTSYCGEDVVLHADETNLGKAEEVARASDAVVVVVGNTAEEEGEFIPGDISLGRDDLDESSEQSSKPPKVALGGDRSDLGIQEDQRRLIEAAARSGKPVIVVMVSGSAILVEDWRDNVDALLHTFYSGMEGGTALAQTLFGENVPSARLPFTIAKSSQHYPFFDKDADVIDYGYWHGYAKLLNDGVEARYPFGYGLSYVDFSYRSLSAQRVGEQIHVSVVVVNQGDIEASEVVQIYITFPGTIQPRPQRILKAFSRVRVPARGTQIAHLIIPLCSLMYRDPNTHSWKIEGGRHWIMAGRNAEDGNAVSVSIDL